MQFPTSMESLSVYTIFRIFLSCTLLYIFLFCFVFVFFPHTQSADPSLVVIKDDLILYDSSNFTHPHVTAKRTGRRVQYSKEMKKKLTKDELKRLPSFSPDVDEACEVNAYDLQIDGDIKFVIRNKSKVSLHSTRFYFTYHSSLLLSLYLSLILPLHYAVSRLLCSSG